MYGDIEITIGGYNNHANFQNWPMALLLLIGRFCTLDNWSNVRGAYGSAAILKTQLQSHVVARRRSERGVSGSICNCA